MKHIKIFALLLAGAVSFGLVGCGSSSGSDSSKQAASSASGDLKPLRLGCPGFDDYPLLENGKLAYDKGYLEEELNAVGYTLDLVTFQEAGPAINEAYASGELDMAFYGEYPAATAYSNARQAFKEKLPRELVSEFEKLKDYEDDYGNESDFITFRKGFQLGMQLAVAGLEKDRLNEALKEE